VKILITLFAILISLNAGAQARWNVGKVSSLHHFSRENIQLSDASFRRYAIRQLRSIRIEFFHLIKKMAPHSEDLIQLQERLTRIHENSVRLSASCPHQLEECRPQLKELYRQLKNLDRVLLDLQATKLNFTMGESSSEVNILIELYTNLSLMSQGNQKILQSLELQLIVLDTPFRSPQMKALDYQQRIHDMLLLAEINMPALLGEPLRGEFYDLWVNFIKKVDQRIIKPRDKVHLINRVEDYNFAWNTFHKNLSKAYDKKLNSVVLRTLGIMHNRWNSILKLMLR
jgi:hypothetical protein